MTTSCSCCVWEIVEWFWGSACYLPAGRIYLCFWNGGSLGEECFNLIWIELMCSDLYIWGRALPFLVVLTPTAQPLRGPKWKQEYLLGHFPWAAAISNFVFLFSQFTETTEVSVQLCSAFQPLNCSFFGFSASWPKKANDLGKCDGVFGPHLFVLPFNRGDWPLRSLLP